MIGALSIWENGDELPNRFLGRRWLDCPLPCALRLRTQRPDHLALGEDGCNGSSVAEPSPVVRGGIRTVFVALFVERRARNSLTV